MQQNWDIERRNQFMQRIGPNFFLIGASKAGTTFLAGLLDQHNEIFISKPKEPQFFAWAFTRGWDWYRQCFEGAGQYAYRGDASTLYSAIATYPECLPRIRDYCPNAKIIYGVRDPLARLKTLWKTYSRTHWAKFTPFESAVRTKLIYIDSSQYWKQYSAFCDIFGSESVYLYFFEDFVQDPERIAKACVEFLGVRGLVEFDVSRAEKNPSSKMRHPRPILRLIKQHTKFPDKVYAALPESAQHLLRLAFKRKLEEPEFSSELRNWVLTQIHADSVRLL